VTRSFLAMATFLPASLALLALAGCQSPSKTAYTGACQPTVEGCSGGSYAGRDAARKAFTRITPDGSLTATLEDVAWLRYEGVEEEVVQKHRAYFDQGYTTFEVTLFTKDFTQPTAETFTLEDSSGARLTAKPVTYSGNMGLENERYAARFSISFRHAITRDLTWVKLTRLAGGESLEWTFPGGSGGGGGAVDGSVPPAIGSAGGITRGSLPKAQPLLRPLNPAPGGFEPGRPVNLLTHPEAAPPRSPPPCPPAEWPPAPPAAVPPSAAGASAVPPPAPVVPTPPPASGPDYRAPPSGALPPPETRGVR
jgi:hypothetical protein